MSLTPKASLQDGLLDVFIVLKISVLKMLYFGLHLLLKKQIYLKKRFVINQIHLHSIEFKELFIYLK